MNRFRPLVRKLSGLLLAAALAAAPAACGNKGEKPAPAQQQPAPEKTARPELTEKGLSGHHREDAKWVPGEYKAPRRQWRDTGVYVDGVPVGVMWFGELPERLEPVWLETVADVDFKPGDPGPHEKIIKERRYRIAEYLEALGVDLSKAKEVHIYGGKGWPAVLKAKDFLAFRDTLYFAFGRETSGKPLIYIPEGLEINTSFDHIAAIAVYIDKKPPKLRDDGDLELDGKLVDDIPYFGEPLRGGVRVYLDDRLATTIKRRKLEGAEKLAEKGEGDTLRWKLLPYLQAQGVKTDGIVRADIIFDERRTQRLDRADLEKMTFQANPQSSGQISFGDGIPVQALALHTTPPPAEAHAAGGE